MRCPCCQAENPASNRFCDQCGSPLEARCAACGASLRAEARFCGACGARVGVVAPAAPPATSSEPEALASATVRPAAAPPAPRAAGYTPKHLAEKILSSLEHRHAVCVEQLAWFAKEVMPHFPAARAGG
jgi:hypothetical protein